MPLTRIGAQNGELPYLRPEIVLLYKAKNLGDHDRADFEQTRERLDAGSRQWLRLALERVHPGHEWLPVLT
jgi:hypothetical protein